jgi:hypothetical protein
MVDDAEERRQEAADDRRRQWRAEGNTGPLPPARPAEAAPPPTGVTEAGAELARRLLTERPRTGPESPESAEPADPRARARAQVREARARRLAPLTTAAAQADAEPDREADADAPVADGGPEAEAPW